MSRHPEAVVNGQPQPDRSLKRALIFQGLLTLAMVAGAGCADATPVAVKAGKGANPTPAAGLKGSGINAPGSEQVRASLPRRPTIVPTITSEPRRVRAAALPPTVAIRPATSTQESQVATVDNNRVNQLYVRHGIDISTDTRAYMNYKTICEKSPTKLASIAKKAGQLIERVLSDFIPNAYAEPLFIPEEAIQTPQELITCIQDIESKRPFLTSEAQAAKHKFKPINVKNLVPQNVIVIDSLANLEKNLSSRMQLTPEQIKSIIASIRYTFRDPITGQVEVFTPEWFDKKEDVEKARAAGNLRARWKGGPVGVIFDHETTQVVVVEQNSDPDKTCDNVSIPISLGRVPGAIPSPTAIGTVPPTIPPTRPAETATNTPPPPPTSTPTSAQPPSSETPTIPPTLTFTSTAVSTPTPTAAKPATETPLPPQSPTSVSTSTRTSTAIPSTSTTIRTATPFPSHTVIPGSSPTPTRRPATATAIAPSSVRTATPIRP